MFKEAVIKTKWGDVRGVETPYGVIVLVDPKWLDVDNGDQGYQRVYDANWANKIAKQWKRSMARPVCLRLRKGLLYVTDGQHTANAAMLAGESEILAIINNGSESRQVEAEEFVNHQIRVKRIRPYDTYRASLVAGHEDALILRKVAGELGIEIGYKRGPNVLASIRAARDIASLGEEALRDTLEVALVWQPEDLDRFQYEILQGISRALDATKKDVVMANAKRTTAEDLYRKAMVAAGGKGFVTISNIAAELGKRRRRPPAPSVIRET